MVGNAEEVRSSVSVSQLRLVLLLRRGHNKRQSNKTRVCFFSSSSIVRSFCNYFRRRRMEKGAVRVARGGKIFKKWTWAWQRG